MTVAMIVEKEIDRILTLLRNKIRERGFTQLEVQESLNWGRSYISQLLTKQKSLRVEQILLILDVIGVDPAEFYGELYHFTGIDPSVRNFDDYLARSKNNEGDKPNASSHSMVAVTAVDDFRRGHDEMRSMLRAVVRILVKKDLLNVDELNETVRSDFGLLDDDSTQEPS